MRPTLRTFDHFPEDKKCIVCDTNEDDKCVLIPISGTGDGKIAEAVVVHLACAIADQYNESIGLIYRRI
jgi:hypothetical protein